MENPDPLMQQIKRRVRSCFMIAVNRNVLYVLTFVHLTARRRQCFYSVLSHTALLCTDPQDGHDSCEWLQTVTTTIKINPLETKEQRWNVTEYIYSSTGHSY